MDTTTAQLAAMYDHSPYQIVECHNLTRKEYYIAVSRTGNPPFPLSWSKNDRIEARLVASAQNVRDAVQARQAHTKTLLAQGESVIGKKGNVLSGKTPTYLLIPHSDWVELMSLLKSIKGAC